MPLLVLLAGNIEYQNSKKNLKGQSSKWNYAQFCLTL